MSLIFLSDGARVLAARAIAAKVFLPDRLDDQRVPPSPTTMKGAQYAG